MKDLTHGCGASLVEAECEVDEVSLEVSGAGLPAGASGTVATFSANAGRKEVVRRSAVPRRRTGFSARRLLWFSYIMAS